MFLKLKMTRNSLVIAFFVCGLSLVLCGVVPSSRLNTKKLIERHNYPFEKHQVQTSDGYLLEVHRIPFSPKIGPGFNRPVAYLQHGLLCSSSDWVLGGPENGLAFLLSDLGYDVWMGNARGNTYSRSHIKHTPLLQPFWNFDWHDIGLYDLPAMIDYVRFYTGEDQVDYFGHSQGTTSFFVMNSYIGCADKIRSAHLMAPIGYMHNMRSPLAYLFAPLLGQPNAFVSVIGSMEFLPSNIVMDMMGAAACRETTPSKISGVCYNTLFLIAGFNQENLNKTLLPEILATTPAGCSVNQILHYLQEYNSAEFREWDYGLMNKKHYKQNIPPKYRPVNVRVPTYFYYSVNDYLAEPVDVMKLIGEMPKDVVKKIHRIKDPKFSHLDYLWGLNAKEMVYDLILKNLGH